MKMKGENIYKSAAQCLQKSELMLEFLVTSQKGSQKEDTGAEQGSPAGRAGSVQWPCLPSCYPFRTLKQTTSISGPFSWAPTALSLSFHIFSVFHYEASHFSNFLLRC